MLERTIKIFILISLILVSCKVSRESKKKEKIEPKYGNTILLPIPNQEFEIKRIELDAEKIVKLIPKRTTLEIYEKAFSEIESMLENKKPLDFKRAVFMSENVFFEDTLNYTDFDKVIKSLASICEDNFKNNKLLNYSYEDSINIRKNGSIYKLMTDKLYMSEVEGLTRLFQYNFIDFDGKKDWSNQFVTRLLQSKKGNCHSLPYLYKILANELRAEAFLSFAPNHIYIKNQSEELGWYNTELTSGQFPTDAWIKASGYITMEAIRSGIYMDTLSEKESVASCVYDLAKGYIEKTRRHDDNFIFKCCDLVLKHHPFNINAMILKAETLRWRYNDLIEKHQNENAKIVYIEMQKLYMKGLKLGYREIPNSMYLTWLASMNESQEKNINQKINATFNSK